VTLLVKASTVNQLVADLESAFDALGAGFVQSEAPSIPGQRTRTDLPANGTATALLPGLLPAVPAYTAKVNAKFPGASPALRGLVCLHSLEDGELLAVFDSASLTAWRTGLVAAFATDILAGRNATTVGLIGAGAQARVILRGLANRRQLASVAVQDIDRSRAQRFGEYAGTELDLDSVVVESAEEIADLSEIVVLATWSTAPLLGTANSRCGQHFTTIGADEPGKQELAPELLSRATLIVDDRALAATMGAASGASLGAPVVDATLSEVLVGQHPGRSTEDEVTVYAPVGLPWQDLALAWLLYERAGELDGGLEYDFLA
jgi:ornithine cyclodeaminase/alanine dehydrogenase-like protein (mu-crystallin family)